jgi:subtilisin
MEADTRGQPLWIGPLITLVTVLILLAGAACSDNQQAGQRRIIVFREGTTRQVHRRVIESHGLQVLRHLDAISAVVTELPDARAKAALAALEREPDVVRADHDSRTSAAHLVSITLVAPPAEEIFPWGLEHTGVPDVFDLISLKSSSKSSSAPTVAILDTGIDIGHPEFLNRIVAGYNAIDGEDASDYQDLNGHGTHTAGIIGAAADGQGIIGTATSAKFVAVKVLDDGGHGYLSDLLSGLEWVLDHKSQYNIRVVNMSLSFSQGSQSLQQLTNQLYNAGVILVASAGNRCKNGSDHDGADDEGGDSGCDAPNAPVKYPAAYSSVVAVVATDMLDRLTDYSRNGPEVSLAAPGGNRPSGEILSTTINDSYGLAYGSSQAAAHVSGAAAVALQLAPALTAPQVVRLLKETAIDLGYSARQQGAGLVAVDNLVKRLLRLP